MTPESNHPTNATDPPFLPAQRSGGASSPNAARCVLPDCDARPTILGPDWGLYCDAHGKGINVILCAYPPCTAEGTVATDLGLLCAEHAAQAGDDYTYCAHWLPATGPRACRECARRAQPDPSPAGGILPLVLEPLPCPEFESIEIGIDFDAMIEATAMLDDAADDLAELAHELIETRQARDDALATADLYRDDVRQYGELRDELLDVIETVTAERDAARAGLIGTRDLYESVDYDNPLYRAWEQGEIGAFEGVDMTFLQVIDTLAETNDDPALDGGHAAAAAYRAIVDAMADDGGAFRRQNHSLHTFAADDPHHDCLTCGERMRECGDPACVDCEGGESG